MRHDINETWFVMRDLRENLSAHLLDTSSLAIRQGSKDQDARPRGRGSKNLNLTQFRVITTARIFSDTSLTYPPLDWLTLSMLNCFMHQWPTRGISLRAIGVTLSWPEAWVSSLSKFKCKNCNANVDNATRCRVFRGRAASEIVFQISSARASAFVGWTIRQKVCEVRLI